MLEAVRANAQISWGLSYSHRKKSRYIMTTQETLLWERYLCSPYLLQVIDPSFPPPFTKRKNAT